jgi:hypothetical protein
MLKTLFLFIATCVIATKCDLSGPEWDLEALKDIAVQVQFATSEYAKLYRALNSQNSNVTFGVVSILNAQKQVVAGMEYYITAEIKDLSSNKTKLCRFLILSQPWLKIHQLRDHECS